jgi:hypothetical protein
MLALAIPAILLLTIAPALGWTMTTSTTTTFTGDTGFTVDVPIERKKFQLSSYAEAFSLS